MRIPGFQGAFAVIAVSLMVSGASGLLAQTAPGPTVKFNRFLSSIAVEETLGKQDFGIFHVNGGPIKWNSNLATLISTKFLLLVDKEIEAGGIPHPRKNESVFEATEKAEPADLELGFRLQGMQLNLNTNGRNSKGTTSMSGKWALFNPKTQKLVAEFPGEADYSATDWMPWTDIVGKCVSALARSVLDRKEFRTVLKAPLDAAPAEATAAYTFPPQAAPAGGVARNSTLLLAAVVTIEAGTQSGSGFYIGRDGYILTNNHVVGEAKFVKVKTATGRELPGEVLACDAKRDVALIKTARPPFEPLSLRISDPAIGDEVFAIGSPLGDQFNGSVSRGVVSGFRNDEAYRFIQSDVSIMPGSSGGPLLDGHGSVVGISTASLVSPGGGKLNFFIPIGEALAKLSIQIKPPEPVK